MRMSRHREIRQARKGKRQYVYGPPVFELPYEVRSVGEMDALYRLAMEVGFEVVGFVVCGEVEGQDCAL